MKLEGHAALVTGAGKRVGRAIALELARRGADIAVHYGRAEQEARATVEAARALGVQAESFQAELSDERQIDTMFDRLLERFPRLAVAVNSASVFYPTPLEGLDGAGWDAVQDVNLKACWLVARRAALHLRTLGYGKIVNLGCVSCWQPWRGYLAYAISKAGLLALTRGLALELAPTIQVNGVAPGTVLFHEAATDELKARVRAEIPAGREGDPQDLADAVAFLITGPDYITGQMLAVDGGRALRG
jgi:pteridine reductase